VLQGIVMMPLISFLSLILRKPLITDHVIVYKLHQSSTYILYNCPNLFLTKLIKTVIKW